MVSQLSFRSWRRTNDASGEDRERKRSAAGRRDTETTGGGLRLSDRDLGRGGGSRGSYKGGVLFNMTRISLSVGPVAHILRSINYVKRRLHSGRRCGRSVAARCAVAFGRLQTCGPHCSSPCTHFLAPATRPRCVDVGSGITITIMELAKPVSAVQEYYDDVDSQAVDPFGAVLWPGAHLAARTLDF